MEEGDLFEGNTSDEKLQNARDIIETLEKQVFKLRAELKRNEGVVKKLQDSVNVSGKNENNTSSQFMLPSEFKKLWESLVEESLLDTFSSFIDDHFMLAHLVQDLVRVVLQSVNRIVEGKRVEICQTLGLPPERANDLKVQFVKVLQDNYQTAFNFTDEFLTETVAAYRDKTQSYLQCPSDFEEVLGSGDFREFVEKIHKLSLLMQLNDPPLRIDFATYLDYQTFEHQEDYYCIDGFPKVGSPCVVIVPPVMRKKQTYAGIKPAVLILKPGAQISEDKQELFMTVHPCKTDRGVRESAPAVLDKTDRTDRSYESRVDRSFDTAIRKKEVVNSYTKKYEQKLKQQGRERDSSPHHGVSPRQVLDLYSRYKENMKKLQQYKVSKHYNEEDYSLPLQKPRRTIDRQVTNREERTPMKEERSCSMCRPRNPCTRCSKTTLLALAQKVPMSTLSQKYSKPTRTMSTSVFDSPSKSLTSLLTKKLSEAARRLDSKSFIRKNFQGNNIVQFLNSKLQMNRCSLTKEQVLEAFANIDPLLDEQAQEESEDDLLTRISSLETRLIMERKERLELQFELNHTIEKMQVLKRDLQLQKPDENLQMLWQEADNSRQQLEMQLSEQREKHSNEVWKLKDRVKFLEGKFDDNVDISEILSCEQTIISTLSQIQSVKQQHIDKIRSKSNLCIICRERDMSIWIKPCNHICTWENWASQISACPMCRTVVTRFEKVFLGN